jgi:methionyl-tRNA formyltransferase
MRNEYIVAAISGWNKDVFDIYTKGMKGNWHFVSTPEELNKLLISIKPKYIFFPHWRWIVPKSIIDKYECICFHMTDVPYGRGGSPLQNLIIRGHKETVLTALRMEEELDAGAIYFKQPLSLDGTAEQIYRRASALSWEMISSFVTMEPESTPQNGDVTVFKRRKPEQSQIPVNLSNEQVYDYIRMLDAPGYPYAFIRDKSYKVEFTNAEFVDGELMATAKIKIKE